jgi:hypothetical protein
MADLHDEADLERALWFLYQQWRLLGYQPTGFYRLFARDCKQYKGGVAAVQLELRSSGPSSLEFLQRVRKDVYSVERLVLRETWGHLFTDDDKRIAEQRLSRRSDRTGRSA